jgi:hypothetical protein
MELYTLPEYPAADVRRCEIRNLTLPLKVFDSGKEEIRERRMAKITFFC